MLIIRRNAANPSIDQLLETLEDGGRPNEPESPQPNTTMSSMCEWRFSLRSSSMPAITLLYWNSAATFRSAAVWLCLAWWIQEKALYPESPKTSLPAQPIITRIGLSIPFAACEQTFHPRPPRFQCRRKQALFPISASSLWRRPNCVATRRCLQTLFQLFFSKLFTIISQPGQSSDWCFTEQSGLQNGLSVPKSWSGAQPQTILAGPRYEYPHAKKVAALEGDLARCWLPWSGRGSRAHWRYGACWWSTTVWNLWEDLQDSSDDGWPTQSIFWICKTSTVFQVLLFRGRGNWRTCLQQKLGRGVSRLGVRTLEATGVAKRFCGQQEIRIETTG